MRRIVLITALCGFLPMTGQAADHELSVELGTFSNNDDTYRLFGGGDTMTSWGLRGGYAIHDRVSIIASYHHHQRGATVNNGEDWENTFHSAYYAELIGLGAKADVEPLKWLQLYTALQGLVYVGTARFDADRDSRTNTGQFTATSLAVGGQWTAGTEFKIRFKANKNPFKKGAGPEGDEKRTLQLAWHIEAGYGIASKHQYRFQDVNADVNGFDANADSTTTMKPDGLVLRSGLGIRF